MKTIPLLIIIAILASTFSANAQNESASAAIPEKEKPRDIKTIKIGKNESDPTVFTIVEEMPMFPDSACLLITNRNEQKQCADRKLMEYINQTVQYPDTARALGITGMVVISFTVEADGQLSDIRILRDPGGTLGAEGLRLMNQMIAEKGAWIPGRQRGVAVAVRFNLPLRFRLNN